MHPFLVCTELNETSPQSQKQVYKKSHELNLNLVKFKIAKYTDFGWL